jgi:transcriptional regulator with XRE-family HTH domain
MATSSICVQLGLICFQEPTQMSVVNVERMVDLRKGRGWGQRQLAKEAGIAHTVISRLEAGTQKDVRVSILIAIAETLNVTVDSLLQGGSMQGLESELIPELQSVIRQMKRQPVAVQRQAAGIIRGFLQTLE